MTIRYTNSLTYLLKANITH